MIIFQVISKYLKELDDVEKRLALAQKMHCHEAVIDVSISVSNISPTTSQGLDEG